MKHISHVFFLLALVLALPLMSCGKSGPTQVEFAMHGFNAGNSIDGYYPVTRMFISGDFMDPAWPPESTVELTLGNDGIFRTTLDFAPGTTIKYKYQVITTGAPDQRWMSTMDGLYSYVEQNYPSADLLPAPEDLAFEDDGFQGMNAVYDVP